MNNETVLLEAMLFAMEGKSPSLAIENQEKREQQAVVRNCRLPKTVNGGIPDECKNKGIPHWGSLEWDRMSWDERYAIITSNKLEWTKLQYAKMGIKILEEANDLFYSVELPEGWEIKPTDHSMWNDVFDDKGRKRISFFYKGAFYDRDAFSNFLHRYSYKILPFDNYESDIPYDERYNKPWTVYLTDSGENIKILAERTFSDASDYFKNERSLSNLATQYLNDRYPNWADINAYWD
jgi:hypothetical protein